MTNEQAAALALSCSEGNDVRIVTIALQVAASAARAGRADEAVQVRRLVDDHQRREARIAERKRLRLEIAARLCAHDRTDSPAGLLAAAETLIDANENTPTNLERP